MKIFSTLCSLVLLAFSCINVSDSELKGDEFQENRDSIPKKSISTEILFGRFDPSTHPHFVSIPTKYSTQSEMYLQREVLDSFISMANKAESEGIELKIVSATRNFARQKAIWGRKWEAGLVKHRNPHRPIKEVGIIIAHEILQFSSMPGTSRHHWGTDIDINNLNDEYFQSGRGEKEYKWLVDNASTYGFCQPYTNDKNRTGYNEEKWHWSFVPIAMEYLNAYKQVSYDEIQGFKGAEYAKDVQVIEKYVFGVGCDL